MKARKQKIVKKNETKLFSMNKKVLNIDIFFNNMLVSKKINAVNIIIKITNFVLGFILNLSSIKPMKKKQVDVK